ncbi:MAG: hypothetical protein JWR56_1700 [Massilia sp.]|nr:hypothetical protein [Massilia sp.]
MFDFRLRVTNAGAIALVALLAACGTVPKNPDVIITYTGTNVVSYWHDVGAATVNATMPLSTTPEEKRGAFQADMATMHLAIYDALSAIDGRYKPFLVTRAPAAGASMDAAASAAAYGVLRALFPNRGAQYQAAYDSYLAKIPAGDAKTRGLALGAEVAAAIVANRANDGRAVALAVYVPGTAPGKFRGVNPISRHFPSIKPFTMTSLAQFRPGPPPALDSATYAADLNEVKALGGSVSATRTAEQFEIARFHTEPPPLFLTRNFGRFASSTKDVADAARLMALIYVGNSDAIEACFEAKYFYDTWRPLSAIPLADTDSNAATDPDAAWKPSVPTPNHPEYPAAHSCTAGAFGELLRLYYGTDKVSFNFDSTVTGTTRNYATTDALAEESMRARIYGGMHFRYSTMAGVALGKQVANWTYQRAFAARN